MYKVYMRLKGGAGRRSASPVIIRPLRLEAEGAGDGTGDGVDLIGLEA